MKVVVLVGFTMMLLVSITFIRDPSLIYSNFHLCSGFKQLCLNTE